MLPWECQVICNPKAVDKINTWTASAIPVSLHWFILSLRFWNPENFLRRLRHVLPVIISIVSKDYCRVRANKLIPFSNLNMYAKLKRVPQAARLKKSRL